MRFLSDILAKAGLIVDGAVVFNSTANGQTPASNDDSTKLATTAWVRSFTQPYTLPIASATILGGVKVGTGLAIDPVSGVLSLSGGGVSIKSTETFTATQGQSIFTITNGYTVGLIDVFLNGVYLSPGQITATNGITITLNDPAIVGDIIDVIVTSPLSEGSLATTDQLPEGTTNLYYTDSRARAAISLTTTGVSGAATYNILTGQLNIPNYQGLVPAGGIAGQILAKNSATSYDTTWIDNYTSQVQHIVKAGVAVTKGQAVYVSSADGTNMIVSKASNASEGTSSKTLGLIAQDLALNGQGFVVTEGLLTGLDTTGANAAGDPVWLGTDGNLIYGLVNKPVAPAHLVFIGVVTRRNANNGEIFVKVQNGFELDELHNLSVKNASDGDMIKYVASTGLWTKIAATTTNISEGTNLYYTDVRVGSYLTANSYATQSYVATQIANLVASAPATLDTLNELATALGNDPNFATTVTTSIGTKVPQARTITINGTAYDLSADRTWSIAAGVTSFNTRTGAITLTSADVTGALGFTPYNAANPSGYITGITSGMVTTALGFTPYNSTNPSGYITSSALSAYLPLTGGTLSGNLLFSNSGTTKRGIQGTVGVNDMWFVGGGATAENAGFLEISTGDDGQTGGAAEPIYVRQYGPGDPLTGTLFRSASLLDVNGNTSFPGTVTAPTFSGSLSGNATNITAYTINQSLGTSNSPTFGGLTVNTGGVSTWGPVVITSTSLWGDGGTLYATIGAGGAAGIMLFNPHVVWNSGNNCAAIRIGRSGGVSTGNYYEIGTGASNNFFIAKESLASGTQLNISSSGDATFSGGITGGSFIRAYKGTASNTPGLEVRGGTGGVRIQTYGLDANADAWMGLGTDMGGNPYEHSVYFPYGVGGYAGAGRQTIGCYDGTTYSTKATFLANGRIGFGITSPEAALHVAQSGQDDQLILGSAANNRDHAMYMYSGPNKAGILRYQSGSRLIVGGSGNISKTSIYGGGSERLTVESGGVTAYRVYSTSGGGYNIVGGAALILGGSGATFDNTTGVRLTESYGPVWNCADGATWHHQVINGSSLVGISAAGTNFGNGRIYASGDITAYYSDMRLKTKISNIKNALDKVLSLNGFYYTNNDIAKDHGYDDNKIQVGVSAQEVEAVLPEIVCLAPFDITGNEHGDMLSKSGENYKTVKYDKLAPLFIEAIKEQQIQIETQESEIAELKDLVKQLLAK